MSENQWFYTVLYSFLQFCTISYSFLHCCTFLFFIRDILVYYAPRDEKLWTVFWDVGWPILLPWTVYYFFFTIRAQSVHFVHARIKRHALNQALYTSYKKIVFDTRVRKWFYPRVAFLPSLHSGATSSRG